GAVGAERLQEPRQRPPAAGLAHAPAELGIARDADDRGSERFGFAGLDEHPRLAVAHDLAEPADCRGDDGAGAFHRLEGDHAEAFAHRRDNDDGRALDRALYRRHVPEEADRVADAELARERAQRRLERAAAGDVEPEPGQLLLRLGERAQQHDVALDRDEAADAEQARLATVVRGGLAVGIDAVVDDLETLPVEPLDLLEVARETA